MDRDALDRRKDIDPVAQQDIRFRTDLITFYSGQFLGLGDYASHAQVVEAIEAEPRRYRGNRSIAQAVTDLKSGLKNYAVELSRICP